MSDETRPGAGRAPHQEAGEQAKEPFISQEDRPEVRLAPDTPIGELRVRDLVSILGATARKIVEFEVGDSPLKEFFDKPFPEVSKDFVKEAKHEKFEKGEWKEFKGEKNDKHEKREKFEKTEIKEIKNEKLEGNPVVEQQPDPRIERLIEAVAGLTKQVGQLANQMEELQKRTT